MLKMRRVIALVSKFRRATIPDGIDEKRQMEAEKKMGKTASATTHATRGKLTG